jgi:TatA/E family protein of Tat protein translocase
MGFHWYDIAILLALALLVFGPKRLPEMGSAVGKTIKEFQRSMKEVTEPEQPANPAIPAAPPQHLASTTATTATTAAQNETAPAAGDTSTAEQ